MVYSPWSKREVSPNFNSKTGEALPTRIGVMHYTIHTYLHKFCEPFLFDSIVWHPWTIIVYGLKGKFGKIWKKIIAISPKLERLHPSKLVHMHCITTPTCTNFLSPFDSIPFLTPMDYKNWYSPWSKRKVSPNFNTKTREAIPTKLVHIHYTSAPTCMNFLSQFYLILLFDTHGL